MNNTQRSQQQGARAVSDLGTWDELRLAIRLYRDPRVSSFLKWFIPIVAAIYVISPVDLIPDFLLGVGQVDDLGVIGMAFIMTVSLIRRLAPKSVVSEHLSEMGRSGPEPTGQNASNPPGDIFDTTYRVTNEQHQSKSRNHQRTAPDGRRVA